MEIVWDVRKAAANIRNHGIVKLTLCSMRCALCDCSLGAEGL